jgi:hypothetical protein
MSRRHVGESLPSGIVTADSHHRGEVSCFALEKPTRLRLIFRISGPRKKFTGANWTPNRLEPKAVVLQGSKNGAPVPPGFSISPIAVAGASGRAGARARPVMRFRGCSNGQGVPRFAPEVRDRRRATESSCWDRPETAPNEPPNRLEARARVLQGP